MFLKCILPSKGTYILYQTFCKLPGRLSSLEGFESFFFFCWLDCGTNGYDSWHSRCPVIPYNNKALRILGLPLPTDCLIQAGIWFTRKCCTVAAYMLESPKPGIAIQPHEEVFLGFCIFCLPRRVRMDGALAYLVFLPPPLVIPRSCVVKVSLPGQNLSSFLKSLSIIVSW